MLRVDKVRKEDRAQVEEIARNTWNGRDYLMYAFDEWVKEGGFYCLRDEEGKIIALDKYTWHENGIIWLEGYRVHPDYRGMGYGWKMAQEMSKIIGKLEYRALRFMTSEANEASIHIGKRLGFRAFAYYYYLYKEIEGGEEESGYGWNDVGTERDVEGTIRFIKSLPEYRENKEQYLAMWTAYDMTDTLLKNEIKKGRYFSVRNGDKMEAVAFFYPYMPRNTMSIAFTGGSDTGIERLIRYGTALSRQKGMERLTLKTASERVKDIAIKAGIKEAEIGKAILWEKR